jgi:hypothetical protein
VSVHPTINFRMPEPIFTELGMYVMTLEPISEAFFTNRSHQSLCLYVYPPIAATKRFCKIVTAATNAQSKIELLEGSFCKRSVSHQRTVGYQFFPELIVSAYIASTMYLNFSKRSNHYISFSFTYF